MLYKNRIYLEVSIFIIPIILKEFHERTHEGVLKTYKRLRAVFYCPGMHKDMVNFVQQRDVCHRAKSSHIPYGLPQPLTVPSQVLRDISMDFITGLPKSQGKDTIKVVVDRLSKSAHFVALQHRFTAATIASLFFDNVLKLYGMVCQPPLCVTETLYSVGISGINCLQSTE